ncbi:hypothetical protein ES703_76790 [subsurface metagenome]
MVGKEEADITVWLIAGGDAVDSGGRGVINKLRSAPVGTVVSVF